MKNFEKYLNEKLNEDFDKLDLKMSAEVRNHQITKRVKKTFNFKLFLPLALTSLILLITLITISIRPKMTKELSYYVLEINPEVVFKTDGKKVIEAKSLNQDGDSLLLDLNLKDLEVKEAFYQVLDEALKEGYIKDDGYAIRVSEVSKNEEFKKLDLESYFKEKGYYVAVAQKKLLLDGDFLDYYNNLETFSYLNKEENFSESYELSLYESLYSEIKLGLKDLKEIETVINELKTLTDELLVNKEVSSFVKDYFYLVKYYETHECPLNVSLIMDEIKTLLIKYETLTGIKIDSLILLNSEYLKFKIINVNLLEKITSNLHSFSEFIKGEFESFVLEIKGLLDLVIPGIEESLNFIFELPHTFEDYLLKMDCLVKTLHESRLNLNEANYLKEREVIKDESYEGFIKGILSEYESLDDYFLKIHQK